MRRIDQAIYSAYYGQKEGGIIGGHRPALFAYIQRDARHRNRPADHRQPNRRGDQTSRFGIYKATGRTASRPERNRRRQAHWRPCLATRRQASRRQRGPTDLRLKTNL